MRQFDVYRNPVQAARSFAPHVIVLSSHLLLDFEDVVVAPLVNDAVHTVHDLEVPVDVLGETLTIVVSDLSTLRSRSLREFVASLTAHEYDIRRALDRLFTGF